MSHTAPECHRRKRQGLLGWTPRSKTVSSNLLSIAPAISAPHKPSGHVDIR